MSIRYRILRQEGTPDVFEVNQWYPSSEEEDSDEEVSS